MESVGGRGSGKMRRGLSAVPDAGTKAPPARSPGWQTALGSFVDIIQNLVYAPRNVDGFYAEGQC